MKWHPRTGWHTNGNYPHDPQGVEDLDEPRYARAMRRVGITLAALLMCATTASAATGHKPPGVTPPPHTEQHKLATYLETARAYWPGSPCAGRETITLNAEPQIAALARHNAHGWGDPNTCHVYLRGGMNPTTFCLVLAHELGHTAGAEHTNRGIMNSDHIEPIGPCADRAADDEYSRSWYRTLARLPAAGKGWQAKLTKRTKWGLEFRAWKRGYIDRTLFAWAPSGNGEYGHIQSEMTGDRR
jgi:hypothetical protein